MAKRLPTRKRLRELFTYLPESGQLVWNIDRGPTAPAGGVAGFLRQDTGTWAITVDNHMHSAHVLVWVYHHGKAPPPLMHINGLRDDNRIENLRPIKGAAGPYTLERIEAKCDVVGECWHWTAGKSGKIPALRHEGKVVNARRYIFTELLGRKLAPGRMVTMSCENLDCVSPEHLMQVTRQQLQQRTAKRTQYGRDPLRSAKLSASKRAASPYSAELVAKALAMEGSSKDVARELGVAPSTITQWRRRSANNPINNPWAGLLAA